MAIEETIKKDPECKQAEMVNIKGYTIQFICKKDEYVIEDIGNGEVKVIIEHRD